MLFESRQDAGRRLARELASFRNQRPAALALPRGGVCVAAEAAAFLAAPLDLILVRKIGAPNQPELAIGAVADGDPPLIVRNEAIIRQVGVSETEFARICDAELIELERRRRRYVGDRTRLDLTGRTAIVIDDGIATGATMLAALQAAHKRQPNKLVLAVPVAPPATLEAMRAAADEIVCLERPHRFDAIGAFYDDFRQVGDEEVVEALQRANEGTNSADAEAPRRSGTPRP
jgi:putative phosphoribosyl transferase